MAEIARVKTSLTGFAGAPGVSTNFFHKRTGLSWDTYGNDMVARIQAAWEDLGTVIYSGMTIETHGEIDILDTDTGAILQTLQATSGSHTGIGTNGYAPLASGICVTWRTAGVVAGKHVRGRTFIVPVDFSTMQTDGTPAASALALVDTFAATYIGTGGEAVVPTVFARPVHATLSGPEPRLGSEHLITEATVSDKFAVLRSRRD